MGGRRAVSAHFHSSNMLAFFLGGGGVEGGQCILPFSIYSLVNKHYATCKMSRIAIYLFNYLFWGWWRV